MSSRPSIPHALPIADAAARRVAAQPERLRHLTQENELMVARLEQERAARLQAEKDLAGMKALLRESNQQLARQKRTLTWRFGQEVTRARSLTDYVMLPLRLYRLSGAHKRERRQMPPNPHPAPTVLPAETAGAIKEALDYAHRVRDAEVILWISKQAWPAQTKVKVYCEVAKWARSSYPHIAEQIAEQLLTLDPNAPHVRQLAFSLYDAGLVTAPAKLLAHAQDTGVEFNTAEQQRARRVCNAHELMRRAARRAPRPRQAFDFNADGPIVIVAPTSLLHGRNAASNALHRHAALLRRRYGNVCVISLAPDDAVRAGARLREELPQADIVLDGVVYKAVDAEPGRTQAIEDAANALSEAVLAATVGKPPRAVLAWDGLRCAIAASAAAHTLRVPYGLVLLGLDYFRKATVSHKLSERGRLELKLVSEAIVDADLVALGSQAMRHAVQQLLGSPREAALLPPLPLPSTRGRKAAAPEVESTLAALQGKRVLALTDDHPDPALARAVIDIYAEIALRRPDTALLVLSDSKTAALMRRHAVSIGLPDDQLFCLTDISDLPSREQLLARVELALFPYIPAQAEIAALPPTASLLESMAHGICPVVGLNPAYAELVEPGRSGAHIDYSQGAADIAHRLLELMEDPEAVRAMGKRARERLAREYPPLEQALDDFFMQAAEPQPAALAGVHAEPGLLRMKPS
ncbi:MAG: glycosyltransferase [Castellaniella sp.]|uniref:glycosyltransferase n=1 Tax=Castellaniella sp. TaxID=1955812 RepID=UPI003C72BF74